MDEQLIEQIDQEFVNQTPNPRSDDEDTTIGEQISNSLAISMGNNYCGR